MEVDELILKNQLAIMKALIVDLPFYEEESNKLKQQITITEFAIIGLSQFDHKKTD